MAQALAIAQAICTGTHGLNQLQIRGHSVPPGFVMFSSTSCGTITSSWEHCGNSALIADSSGNTTANTGLSKSEIADLFRIQNEKLVRDLDYIIQQHLENCIKAMLPAQSLHSPKKKSSSSDSNEGLSESDAAAAGVLSTNTVHSTWDAEDYVVHEESCGEIPSMGHQAFVPMERAPLFKSEVSFAAGFDGEPEAMGVDVSVALADDSGSDQASSITQPELPQRTESVETNRVSSDVTQIDSQTKRDIPSSLVRRSLTPEWETSLDYITSTMPSILPLRQQQINQVIATSGVRETRQKRKVFISVVVSIIIVINAIFVGLRVKFAGIYNGDANSSDARLHPILNVGSFVFCLLFTAELLGKLLMTNRRFFHGDALKWNLFDAIVVSFMWLGEASHRTNLKFVSNLSITWVSALRLAHFLRRNSVLRAAPIWPDIQIVIFTMQKCFVAAAVHLGIIVVGAYWCALVLTEASAGKCSREDSEESTGDLCHLFGSISASMFTMYAAILGGLPWASLYMELRPLGISIVVVFVCFVTFVPLVLLNSLLAAVIAVHQEMGTNALDDYAIRRERRRRAEYTQKLTQIYKTIDVNGYGTISREELDLALQDEGVLVLLDLMSISSDDVDSLFGLLDLEGSNGIEVQQFVMGCLRISGSAKASDVCILLDKIDSLNKSVQEMHSEMVQVKRSTTRTFHEPVKPLRPSLHEPLPQRTSRRSLNDASLSAFGSWPMSAYVKPNAANARTAMPKMSALEYTNHRSELREEVNSWKQGGGNRIPKVEERAMTLEELMDVCKIVELLCPGELWRDEGLMPLQPEDVNLYHFNDYVICPETLPKGAILSVLPQDVHCDIGHRVQLFEESGGTIGIGVIDEILNPGSFRIRVIQGRFLAGCPHRLHVGYEESATLVQVEAEHVSYKELIASHPVKTSWFVSHWWGEGILDFVRCVEHHVQLHKLSPQRTGYWVCAYANNQHDLGMEFGADVENSSFMKSMYTSIGTLLVLDARATSFGRIWCDYEIYKTITEGKPFEVVTVSRKHGRPCCLTEKPARGETSYTKMKRERGFPLHILAHGMRVKLELGQASQESDKEQILKSMAADLKLEGHDFHTCLELACSKANTTLNAYFAVAAWPLAVTQSIVQDFDLKHPGTLSLPDVLKADNERKRLVLSFAHIQEMSDKGIATICKGIPNGLKELVLHFKSCTHISDSGLIDLSRKLRSMFHLDKLHLDFSSCAQISDRSLIALANSLPPSLTELRVDFAVCPRISESGVKVLARCIPLTVNVFYGTFKGTTLNREFDGVREMTRFSGAHRNFARRLTRRGSLPTIFRQSQSMCPASTL